MENHEKSSQVVFLVRGTSIFWFTTVIRGWNVGGGEGGVCKWDRHIFVRKRTFQPVGNVGPIFSDQGVPY